MQITIDTNKDSQSDIKKAIKLLQSLIGDVSEPSELPSESGGFMNMFGSESDSSEKSEESAQISEEEPEVKKSASFETY